MTHSAIFSQMKTAIESAPRNGYVAEIHLQVLKHAHMLENVSGKDFCAGLDLKPAWGTEFSKMRKIAERLRQAGMDPALI